MIGNLVSTVIPVFNRGAMLREAVASVLAQTWRPIEIIIVDDGSTDDTAAVAAGLAAAHPEIVRVLHQSNAGPGVARQRGLEDSRGEFVQFLDSDDLLLPEKFALQVAGLRGDPDAGIAYGKTYTRVHGKRQETPAQRSAERYDHLFPSVLNDRLWETVTPLYRRSALERIGPWSRRRQLEDWEFDCRAAAAGIKLCYCDAFVAEYVQHQGTRLCHAWMNDIEAMRDRTTAYLQVAEHAHTAGIAQDAPEMQRFARSLFWMARCAGARGLDGEAHELFERARYLSINSHWEFRLFRVAVAIIGWRHASLWTERMKKKPA